MRDILVKKNEGGTELFNESKLIDSLKKSGAKEKHIQEILTEIESNLHREITSDEIYQIAFSNLKKKENKTAVNYSLRRSMLSLGPTGFPFEVYISKLFEARGYETLTGQVLKGKCADHEIDVLAWKNEELILMEAKFHNSLDIKTDIKVALYMKARFDDLKDQVFNFGNKSLSPTKNLIITNTKFSSQAISYSKCADVSLIGWDFPKKENLYDLIEKTGIYPLTSLQSLNKEEKIELIHKGIIDCSLVKNKKEELVKLGLPEKKIQKILDEVKEVCNIE